MSIFTRSVALCTALFSVSNALHSTLSASLPQASTNGLSDLGTFSAPQLKHFLSNNPLPQGYPWGGKTCLNSNPYDDSPTTGVTRTYHFVIERGSKAPDGVNKSVILINGQFPGPMLEANWGDMFQITVENKITGPEEGTSLHWHGLLQKESPWYDGVPSVQQCPIAPGGKFTYNFKADVYGTSWYHSHYSSQYADGLLGAMIIHGPKNAHYDVDLGPVFLTDWYHDPYFTILEAQEANNPAPASQPFSDNNLINGKNNFDCSKVKTGAHCTPNAGLSKFKFEHGKTHRLRLINGGAEGLQRFTIDDHEMTIIADDFVPIKPYKTKMVTLGVGQRTDILVKATGKRTDAVWMRSTISTTCSVASQPYALAPIYYNGANMTIEPTTIATPYSDAHCGNDPLEMTVPFYPFSPIGAPATTKTIDIQFRLNETKSLQWYMNNQTFRGNYDHPLLLLANLGNTSYPDDPQWNVYNFGKNKTIRLVVRNQVFVPRSSHPMHLHGHNMFVVAEGVGEWDGKVNTVNPMRRDTQMLQPGSNSTGINQPGYLVIDFTADNPGVWPFHCHIAWHVSSGLYVNIMERPDLITEKNIPSVMAQTCRDWSDYTGHQVVDQIDSGL